MIPEINKSYTAKEIKENGWQPCIHCKIPHLCNSQCTWAYWNSGDRENTLYRFVGDVENPVYNTITWEKL